MSEQSECNESNKKIRLRAKMPVYAADTDRVLWFAKREEAVALLERGDAVVLGKSGRALRLVRKIHPPPEANKPPDEHARFLASLKLGYKQTDYKR